MRLREYVFICQHKLAPSKFELSRLYTNTCIRSRWKRISKKMKQEEKQKKFHESLLKMLYPPPPPPPQAEEDEEGKLKNSTDTSYHLPGELDDNRNSSSSSSDDNSGENGGSEKLTRAQRKRLRKRKFKEAASRRREIIGPLLPNSTDNGNDGGADSVGNTLQSVGQKTASGSSTVTNNSGAPAFWTKKNKIRQRRKAKNCLVKP